VDDDPMRSKLRGDDLVYSLSSVASAYSPDTSTIFELDETTITNSDSLVQLVCAL